MAISHKLRSIFLFQPYIALLVFTLIILTVSPKQVKALGISPLDIEINNALPSSIIDKHIFLSNSNAEDVGKIVLVEFHGDLADMISPSRQEVILIQDQEMYKVPFKISLNNTPPGTYTAKYLIKHLPNPSAEGSGTMLSGGLQGEVKVNVTDKKVLSFEISGIDIDDMESGSNKTSALIIAENNGNMPLRIDQIKSTFSKGDFSTSSYRILEKPLLVPPFSKRELIIPAGKAPKELGLIDVTLEIFNGNKLLYKANPQRIQVHKRPATHLVIKTAIVISIFLIIYMFISGMRKKSSP